MDLKMIVLNEKCTPTRAYEGDAGIDLYANTNKLISIGQHQTVLIPLGICLEIPYGNVGLLLPRSSISKSGLIIQGVIDAGYRNEIRALIHNITEVPYHIQPHEKIAQILIVPITPIKTFQFVDKLNESERGEKGFGSSGK